MKNKRVLVTGAAGFIGTNLVRKLLLDGNEVVSLDIREPSFGEPVVCDIIDPKWVYNIGRVDYIFHLAATVGVDYVSAHPFETMNTEIYGIGNIIKYALIYKPKKIIYTSSSVVYGQKDNATEENTLNTDSSYGVAKYLAEVYLRELKKRDNINFSIGRLFNVYGPYQNTKMVIAKFIEQAFNNKPLTVYGDGKQTRDFTYIGDVVEVMIRMAENKKANGEIFNVGSGEPTRLVDLAKEIVHLTISTSKIKFKKPSKKIEKFDSIKKRYCCNKKVGKLLKFRKWTTLKEGLKKTIEVCEDERKN